MEQAKKYLAIRISPLDNVATVVAEICSGTTVNYLSDGKEKAVLAVSPVPIYHKIALRDINKGEMIIKYGENIAFAVEDIPEGSHVHNHNVSSGGSEK